MSVCAVAFASAMLGGCSSTSTSTVSQYVDDLAWLPDESGLLAYIDKVTISSLDGSTIEGANLYHVSSSGSIGNSINPSDEPINSLGYPPIVVVAPDGHSAITPFSNDIYRVDLTGSGGVTDIIQNEGLIGVSRGSQYVSVTSVASSDATKLVTMYRLTGGTAQTPLNGGRPYTIVGVNSQRFLWLDDAHFAATIYDSTGAGGIQFNHVTIFDTAANKLLDIPNAEVSLHASAYAPKSGDLFVRNYASGIDRIHLDWNNLLDTLRTSIVTGDTVASFDVSSDGTLLVYSSEALSTNGNYPAYAVNVSNGHRSALASNVIAPVISPNADRVGYIEKADASGDETVGVIAVTLPQ